MCVYYKQMDKARAKGGKTAKGVMKDKELKLEETDRGDGPSPRSHRTVPRVKFRLRKKTINLCLREGGVWSWSECRIQL